MHAWVWHKCPFYEKTVSCLSKNHRKIGLTHLRRRTILSTIEFCHGPKSYRHDRRQAPRMVTKIHKLGSKRGPNVIRQTPYSI